MEQIPILSEKLSAAELKTLLQAEMDDGGSFSLIIKELEGGYRADPATLVALISGGAALIGVVIAKLVEMFLKVYEKNQDRKNMKVVIKGKSGRSIEMPLNATDEQIEKFLTLAKKLDEEEPDGIKYIATIRQ